MTIVTKPLVCRLLWLYFHYISFLSGLLNRDPSFSRLSRMRRSSNNQFLIDISKEISRSTGSVFEATTWSSGSGGGSGASVGFIRDSNNNEYFVKSASLSGQIMLNAEFRGIKEIYMTNTIRVPRPIVCSTSDFTSYAVFEKLNLGGSGDAAQYAKVLCAMHRCSSSNGMFGWAINNTIGATHQPNTWAASWPEFWDRYRLSHMLGLAEREGADFPEAATLRAKVREILSAHHCVPSLVHGDLWSGNQAYTKNGDPVIFDPAVYYGDREVDIAMTKLFGSNSQKFYDTYNNEWELPEGYQLRETIYNLYHILNHYVLFGGGYLWQAKGMIDKILNA